MKLLSAVFKWLYSIAIMIILAELFFISFVASVLNLRFVIRWAMKTAYSALWWSHKYEMVDDTDFITLEKKFKDLEKM